MPPLPGTEEERNVTVGLFTEIEPKCLGERIHSIIPTDVEMESTAHENEPSRIFTAMLSILQGVSQRQRQLPIATEVSGIAAVKLPSGETVSGEVQGWNGYSDGDMLQVTIDGITYLTHSSNVVLVKRPK